MKAMCLYAVILAFGVCLPTFADDTGVDVTVKAPQLKLTPDSAHTVIEHETVVTSTVGKVMSFGLYRGFMSILLSPVELARGTSFEFSIRKWYFACATMIPTGLGGTLARLGAGLADISTLGFYGDTPLAEGFPDFVWQEDWSYNPAAPQLSTVISTNIIPASLPQVDINVNDLSRRQKPGTSYDKNPPSKE